MISVLISNLSSKSAQNYGSSDWKVEIWNYSLNLSQAVCWYQSFCQSLVTFSEYYV